MDPLTARVFRALRSVARLHQQIVLKKLVPEGGHPAGMFCLRLVVQHDGITQRDLAERLHLSRPWITKILQAMEKDGFVVRRVDERDQRLTRVYVTDAGRARDKELQKMWADYLNQTFGTLSEDDRLELERIIGSLGELMMALLGDEQVMREKNV